MIGGEGLHPLDLQVKRIAAIRSAVGSDFFINARTDLFLKTQTYDDALIDQVVERGKAFADSGASGFFVPRLADPKQIERVVREVPLPLNVIAFPGAPDKKVLGGRGRRADQPRPVPAPGIDGDADRDGAGGDRLVGPRGFLLATQPDARQASHPVRGPSPGLHCL